MACSSEDRRPPKLERKTSERSESSNENRDSTPANTANDNMTKPAENSQPRAENIDKTNFHSVLHATLEQKGMKTGDIYDSNDVVQKRILEEYGAIFLTIATPPSACMYKSADEVINFQNKVTKATEMIAGSPVELQADAMKKLLEARKEAKSAGLDITPRDGAEASKRGFEDTLRLWNSRFEPALKHWQEKGRLTADQVSKLRSLPINEQVKEVLELEKQGIYFNTFFNATILSSVAAPGTSQHLSMLAFDATEFENTKVRKILGNYGWFRTVKGDAPHFYISWCKRRRSKE